jgi:hypothetical protein
MSLGTRVALSVAFLAVLTTNGFSAAPKGDPESAKDAASMASRPFGAFAGKKLVSIDGWTIAVNPLEPGLAREIAAPDGTAQKTVFTFINDKLGMVLNAADKARAIGMFRTIDGESRSNMPMVPTKHSWSTRPAASQVNLSQRRAIPV